jgi:hypothetical protein
MALQFWPLLCTHSNVREPPSRIVNLYRARAQALFRGERDFFAGAGDSVMLTWQVIPPVFFLGRNLKSGEMVGGPGKLDFAG